VKLIDLVGTRQIITVSGAQKGVGKTALSEILLRNLPNFSAIKITITDHDCRVTDDEQVILSPSTDTCRMKNSGALQVVWVRSTESCLFDAMVTALEKPLPGRGILVEGNSILGHLRPTLAFFVARPPLAAMKPSRVHALQKADVCVINRDSDTIPDQEMTRRLQEVNPGLMVLTVDLLDPAGPTLEDYTRILSILNERLR
jgi:Ni2+-binding GTPase involved in maturation of urease and hydrogenase